MTGATWCKKTEIGLIPVDWNFGKIIDFSKTKDEPIQTGPFGAQLHSSDYVKEGIPLILIKNIQGGKIIEDDIPRISLKKANELSRYRLKAGDIVFSRVGSVGRSAVITEHHTGWLLSGQMLRVRLENPEISNDFLSYMIQTSWFEKALVSKIVGATRKSINTEILSNLPIIKPDITEQHCISTILSTVDDAIQHSRQAAAETERLKAGVMHELMTKGIGHTEFREDPDVGRVPKEWSVKKLGEISTITSGGTPSRTEKKFWNGNIPWIKTGEINYNVITSTEEKITKEGLENSAARLVPKGTLLMALYGQGVTRGRVAITGIDATVNQACAAITFNNEIETKFAFYNLTLKYKSIRELSGGSNQNNLNIPLIKTVSIPLPSLKEQQKISTILTILDRKLSLQHQRTAHYEKLKQGLMNELLTGKRRVKVT